MFKDIELISIMQNSIDEVNTFCARVLAECRYVHLDGRVEELLRERELLFLLSGVANPRDLLAPRLGTGRRAGGGSTETEASDVLR